MRWNGEEEGGVPRSAMERGALGGGMAESSEECDGVGRASEEWGG